jgi:hypothetical protein
MTPMLETSHARTDVDKGTHMGKPGRAVRAAGWVAVGAIAAGGVATAATTTGGSDHKGTTTTAAVSTVPAATTPSTTPSARAGKAGKAGRAGRLGKLQGRLLHGEFTVEGKDGKPVNVAEQRGTVNTVTSTSITLTSKDGFSHTYVVDSSTRVRVDGKKGAIGSVKTGQDATVLAKVSGSTETAELVVQRPAKPAN